MLRPRLRIPQLGGLLRRPTPFSRRIHHVPVLDHLRPDTGVPGLLTPDGFDFAWTQYMNLIIQKLDNIVAGTDLETLDTLAIVKATAREPSQAAIFNYASMAHNNALFFQGLKGAPAEGQEAGEEINENEPYEERIPIKLRRLLESNFSSIETLHREFVATAMGMFGPGFVWLIKNSQTQEYRILATYLAGTPYTAGHWRRQPVDMNSQGASGLTVGDWLERAQAGSGGGSGGMFQSAAPGGTDVIPLLCLNTWQHVWLRDYGISGSAPDADGNPTLVDSKRLYVENWWQCINWDRVETLSGVQEQDMFKGMRL